MILGVDTSCYTTSMIVIDVDTGDVKFEKNKNLTVKPGERGLRQSEGFFQHIHHLSETFDLLCQSIDVRQITAISVSSKPRSVEGSYMPVFHAGLLFSSNIANALKVPLYQTSHQDGHLMAAIATSGLKEIPKHFYGLHLSGGTTELLEVTSMDQHFDVKLLGGTLDINFGQLIDRIGVRMGLQFPCGKEMDHMAQMEQHTDFYKIKFKTTSTFNLSGFENKYNELVLTHSQSYVSRHIFNTIAYMIHQMICSLDQMYPILISGGVASNSIIRTFLLEQNQNKQLYFALPEYSRDNALGVAEMARRMSRSKEMTV